MNLEKIQEILEKIPISIILALYLAYLGYDYYSFTNDDASPLVSKQKQIEAVKVETDKLQAKLKQMVEFKNSLELRKTEVRKLAATLEGMKGTLSESLDIPEFMKTAITEAKKVGLSVVSLRPGESKVREYYAEQAFDLTFKGVYVQLLVFFQRMADLQKIVRIEDFAIKPTSSSLSRYVQLEGVVQLKVYRYVGSKADTVTGDEAPTATPQKVGPGRVAPQPGGGH